VIELKRRMNHIFAKDNRTFILAMDHGAGLNVLPTLNDTRGIIEKCVGAGVDAVITTYGITTTYAEALGNAGVILRIDGGTSEIGSGKAMSNVYSVEDALRIGADGVICMGFPGSKYEDISLQNLSINIGEASKWGMPLVAEMLPMGFEDFKQYTPNNIALACRIGAENGADIIKTQYTGDIDSFRTVVEGCYKPVVILGGGNTNTDADLLKTIKDSLEAGGAGVAIGRSIWRHPHPEKLCKAIVRIIHDEASVEQALLELR
jgi:DhnA family fructose-bisphosphate aldolase class Ia